MAEVMPGGYRVYIEKSLHLPPNFAVNMKLLIK